MKPGSNRLKKAYALIAASCLCTGSLLILKSFWELYTGTLTAGAADAPAAFFLPGLTETESIRAEFFYSPGCLLLFSAVCLLLITWSEEKRLRLPVWGGLFLLTILAELFVFLRGRNITGISSSEAAISSVNPAAARELYLLFVITALFVLLCGFMAYISLGRLWLKGLILLFQISILVVYAVFRISFSKLGIALILFCLLLFMAETAACFINRGKETASVTLKKGLAFFFSPPSENILYLTPVFLAAALLLTLIPAGEKPVRWDTLRSIAAVLEEKTNALLVHTNYIFSGSRDTYGLSFTGYSGDGSVEGSLLPAPSSQLSVTGSRTKSPLYLTGTIHDFYNGHGWEQRALDKNYSGEEYLLQYQQLESALSQSSLTPEEQSSLIRTCRFEVKYEGLKTETLFFAPYTSKFVFTKGKPPDTRYDSLVLPKAHGVGYSYTLLCLDVDWGSPLMQQLLRQEAWAQAPVSDENQRRREDYIYQHYTVLPDTVPSRVYALAEEITQGASTDYDKLKQIEVWLSGLAYTTSPSVCPKGQDFTDYFLFDSPEGYCTYFATAMAVLGRCCKIPTRYVEGYITTDTRRADGRQVYLTGDNAHAWTECYIDNVGWIPFEPTPRYYEAAAAAWSQPAAPAASSSGLPGPSKPEPEMEQETAAEIQPSPAASYLSLHGKSIIIYVGEVLILLLVLFLLLMLFLFCRNRLRHRAYSQLCAAEKLEAGMKKALYLGELQGIWLEKGETLSSYGKRAGSILDTPECLFADIIYLYQSVRFGNVPASEEQVQKTELYTQMLEKQYLSGCGRMKRLLYRLK